MSVWPRVVFLFSVLILPFTSSFCAEGAGKTTLRLFYSKAFQFSISIHQLAPLEVWMRREPGSIEMNRLETKKAYFSNGYFLLETPEDLKRERLKRQIKNFKVVEEIEILESANDILFVYPKTHYPVLDRLQKEMSDRSSDGHLLGVTRRKAFVAMAQTEAGEEIPVLILNRSASPGDWSPSILFHYHVKIEGRPSTITIIGKPLGGPAILSSLKKKIAETRGPKLVLQTGSGFPSEDTGASSVDLFAYLKTMGWDIAVPNAHDWMVGWKELQKAPTLTGAKELVVSNLNAQEPGGNSFYKPWTVHEMGGVRVGVFSLFSDEANSLFKTRHLPYRAEDPFATANKITEELKKNQRVDLVICVSYLKKEDEARLLVEQAHGIDILLGNYSHEVGVKKRLRLELEGWGRDSHREPVYQSMETQYGFGEIFLEFEGRELKVLEAISAAIPAETQGPPELYDYADQSFDFYLKPQEMILPDYRSLWPSKDETVGITYSPLEFWNLAAQILRLETGAEAALMKLSYLGSNIPGPVPKNFVSGWLYPDEEVVLVRLPGKVLRGLLPRVDFGKVPANRRDSSAKYVNKTWLAAAGLDAQGRISGLTINDNEFYRVAMPKRLLKDKELRELQDVPIDKTHRMSKVSTVLNWLAAKNKEKEDQSRKFYHESLRRALGKRAENAGEVLKEKLDETFAREKQEAESRAQKNFEDKIRGFCEGRTPKKPVWRLNLRELSLQVANTQVDNRAFYPGVPNARVQALNQRFVRSTTKLYSELFWNRFTWNTGFTADYGRLTLRPDSTLPIKNETVDLILGEMDVAYRAAYLGPVFLNSSFGPFVNFSEETEFTKPVLTSGLPRRQLVRGKAGVKLYQGRFLQELSFAALYQRNYAKKPKDDDRGWEAGLSWMSPLPKANVYFQLQGYVRRIEPDASDTAIDLKQELNARASLQVPLWENLNLSPFVDLYRFKGQFGQPLGENLIFGVSLSLSRLWKPLF